MEPTGDAPPALLIDAYEVIRPLGHGGMAQTWLCRQRGASGFSRQVVLKTLRPEFIDNPTYHAMFLDEARIGTVLQHPNVPRVERYDTYRNVPYIVQEYVDGPRLSEMVTAQREGGTIDIALASRIVADLAAALDYVHRAVGEDGNPLNLVHRDVSSSNVIVSKRGPAKLIDFGVAFYEQRETDTEVGVRKGKPRYIAPEYLLGLKDVTAAADVYALGVLTHLAWTGQYPKQAGGGIGYLPPALHETLVGPSRNELLVAMLDPDPDRRPTVADVYHELEAIERHQGGLLSDEAVRGHIERLFPRGVEDWSLHGPVDETSLRTLGFESGLAPTAPSAIPRRVTPPPRRRSRALSMGVGVGGALLLVALGAGGGLMLLEQDSGLDPTPAAEVTLLLDEAQEMLDANNPRAALDLLGQVRALGTADATSRIRMSRLASEARRADYRHAVQTALEAWDRRGAREALGALMAEFPDDEQGLAWMKRLRPRSKKADEATKPEAPAEKEGAPDVPLGIDGTVIEAGSPPENDGSETSPEQEGEAPTEETEEAPTEETPTEGVPAKTDAPEAASESPDGEVEPAGADAILGSLSHNQIDEVVKRHMNPIRYCYERELTQDPTLEGKVVIKFTIAADGAVSSAVVRTSTLGSDAVGVCMAGRFMGMQFDAPQGGGIVTVSYPFRFAPR